MGADGGNRRSKLFPAFKETGKTSRKYSGDGAGNVYRRNCIVPDYPGMEYSSGA